MPSQQIPAPNLAHPQEPNHVNWRQGAVMGAFGGISMIAGAAITNLVPASIPTAFTAGASATTWFLTSYATPTIANAALGFGAATVGGVTATVAPPIAVELAVGTTAQYTFNTAYYLWNKNQHQSPLMQKLTQIKGQFKKSNPRNPMTLTLESWEPDYILELGKLLNEKLIGKAKGKPLFKKIEIDAGNMSLPQWESLLSNGLGEFGTQHLAIHNSNQLNQRILISLYEKITQGTFQNLTTLDLSDNHLTPQHLPWLEQIAQKLNLETLILSNNHFNLVEHAHSTENFKSFFSQLHQTMPALKKLEIKNIQLHADSLSYLSPLFTQLSLLSHIAFNQNNIGLNPITELLKNKAHLGNMSLERIVTGQNHHPQVEKLLTIRSNALNALKDKLSNSENTHSAFNIHPLENEVFLFKLLKFIVNEHDSTEKIQ